jgi:pilus assembly protein Flp/PilA
MLQRRIRQTRKQEMNHVLKIGAHTYDRFKRLLADERGTTAIEYALIAAGVGVAIAATVFSFGSDLKSKLYDKVNDAMP